MNLKIIVIVVALIVLAAAVFTYNYLNKTQEEGAPLVGGEEEVTEEPAALKETVLTKQGFEITLPPGWQEEENPPYLDVLLMAIDSQEEIVDQEFGFRTNLTIKNDDLSLYQDLNSVADYFAIIKENLIQAISVIEFVEEKEETVNSNQAYFTEIESTQEEVDFKTLLVFIREADDTIWGLSFNTYQDSWPAYQSLFYQMARSFKTENET